MNRSRSVELFFVDGHAGGILTAVVPFQWTGHIVVAPRTQLSDVLQRPEVGRPGVYLLLGEDDNGRILYIGESDDIRQRIKSHDWKKDWWSTVVFITSSGEQLNKAHARYLESRLVSKATQVGKVRLDNSVNPSVPAMSEAAISHMEAFLDNLFFVLPALQFDFFVSDSRQELSARIENSDDVFVFKSEGQGIHATAKLVDGLFLVQKGSKVRGSWVGVPATYTKLYNDLVDRKILVDNGTDRIFSEDYAFDSVSAAGAVVTGRSTNGRIGWKHISTGKTYAEWEENKLKLEVGER